MALVVCGSPSPAYGKWKMPAKEAFPPRDYETCHKCSLHLFEVMFRMAADPVRRLMSGIRIQHMAKKSRFLKLMIWGDCVILIASDRHLTWAFVGCPLSIGPLSAQPRKNL